MKIKKFWAIFVCFILFPTSFFLSSHNKEKLKQERSGQNEQVIEDMQLRDDILVAYKLGGELRLQNFVQKEKDKIPKQFIVDFVIARRSKGREGWIEICEIVAKEKNDEKTLADVFLEIGESFRLISDNIKAAAYFDQALSIYLKLNDPAGQGKIYLRKGIIYSVTGDYSRAIEHSCLAPIRPNEKFYPAGGIE